MPPCRVAASARSRSWGSRFRRTYGGSSVAPFYRGVSERARCSRADENDAGAEAQQPPAPFAALPAMAITSASRLAPHSMAITSAAPSVRLIMPPTGVMRRRERRGINRRERQPVFHGVNLSFCRMGIVAFLFVKAVRWKMSPRAASTLVASKRRTGRRSHWPPHSSVTGLYTFDGRPGARGRDVPRKTRIAYRTRLRPRNARGSGVLVAGAGRILFSIVRAFRAAYGRGVPCARAPAGDKHVKGNHGYSSEEEIQGNICRSSLGVSVQRRKRLFRAPAPLMF